MAPGAAGRQAHRLHGWYMAVGIASAVLVLAAAVGAGARELLDLQTHSEAAVEHRRLDARIDSVRGHHDADIQAVQELVICVGWEFPPGCRDKVLARVYGDRAGRW